MQIIHNLKNSANYEERTSGTMEQSSATISLLKIVLCFCFWLLRCRQTFPKPVTVALKSTNVLGS